MAPALAFLWKIRIRTGLSHIKHRLQMRTYDNPPGCPKRGSGPSQGVNQTRRPSALALCRHSAVGLLPSRPLVVTAPMTKGVAGSHQQPLSGLSTATRRRQTSMAPIHCLKLQETPGFGDSRGENKECEHGESSKEPVGTPQTQTQRKQKPNRFCPVQSSTIQEKQPGLLPPERFWK